MNINKYLKYGIAVMVLAGVSAVPLYLFLGRAEAASLEQQTRNRSDQYETVEKESDTLPSQTEVTSKSLSHPTEELLATPQTTSLNGGLNPTPYTSSLYIPPAYDPFSNKYRPYSEFEEKIQPGDRAANTPPKAKFVIRTKQQGLADTASGTTNTDFIFDAYPSTDAETRDSNLSVRFDFESDGKWDTYFSRTKRVQHRYDQPGTYKVTLQVMDGGGLTDTASATVTVVENTKPFAHFYYSPASGIAGRVFTFNTNKSYDSQYRDSALMYRFDWNGDGIWDTPYRSQKVWRQSFETGRHKVIMEVKDPEGAVDTAWAVIEVFENTPPVAAFTIEKKQRNTYGTYGTDFIGLADPKSKTQPNPRTEYFFDASGSTDAESPPSKLRYRWDFNYTGPNDIQFDTLWQNSPKARGYFDFPGERIIRLQVMDEDGAVSTAYAKIVTE